MRPIILNASLLVCGFLVCQLGSTQILRVTEISGHDKIDTSAKSIIVDINSRLEISIDPSRFPEKQNQFTSTDESFTTRVNTYKQVLELQSKIVESYNGEAVDFNKAATELEKSLKMNYPSYYKLLRQLINDNKLREAYIKFGKEFAKQPNISKSTSSAEMLSVTILARLITNGAEPTQVAIKNYNTLREGNTIVKDIFSASYSDEEINLVKDLLKSAEELWKNTQNALAIRLENLNVSSLKDKVNNESFSSFGLGETEIQSGRKEISERLIRLTNLTLGKPDNRIAEEIDLHVSVIKDMVTELSSLEDKVGLEFQSAYKKFLADLTEFSDTILTFNKELITPTERIVDKAESADATNIYYSIDDAPIGFINLKNIGNRKNFDELEISLEIKSKKASDLDATVVKELVSLTLAQVKVHAQTNVGVILANSFRSNPALAIERQFQLAPNSNLVFKWGSRKNDFINFTQPGIGISISTPDFDMNTIPDFSFGLVGTMFRDVLSLGVSYNTAIDNPFWFIGFSLPFAKVGLPIGNIQNENLLD